ncbi:hypothetical protein RCL_jg619.t1 [Rhizophagus clarus]|uniref:Uncharacterized protein n=1 Tax=Rhizophagus clarus TaxID=94130 RepID=A0A8H3QS45_9GLOM|nr:hypothetical protein RCL_jg619.t1 [Rhizophagus clarus]
MSQNQELAITQKMDMDNSSPASHQSNLVTLTIYAESTPKGKGKKKNKNKKPKETITDKASISAASIPKSSGNEKK